MTGKLSPRERVTVEDSYDEDTDVWAVSTMNFGPRFAPKSSAPEAKTPEPEKKATE